MSDGEPFTLQERLYTPQELPSDWAYPSGGCGTMQPGAAPAFASSNLAPSCVFARPTSQLLLQHK